MTKFLDGPAVDVILALRRAPLFLRAVCSGRKREWDALDQLDDTMKPMETPHAYLRVEYKGMVHIRCSPRSASGFYAMASYAQCDPQPDEAAMRDNEKWRQWAHEQIKEPTP